jgi:hypothetical protein
MKKSLLTLIAAALALQANAQTYTPITLTGFNYDLVANGPGSAMSSTTNAVDNSDFAFVAQNFVNPSNQSPSAAGSLPNSGLVTSAITTTPGLTFQLAPYTGNNGLRLASGASGTLLFSTPQSANDLYVFLTPAAYSGTCPTTITVKFTDGTNQVFSGISLSNWYGSTTAAFNGTDRVKRSTNAIDVQPTGPKIYQQKLTLNAANTSKLIESILVNNNSAVSTTNVLVVLAVTTAKTFAADAGIAAVTSPNSGCPLTNQEIITISVRNFGSTPQTNVPVSYKINNGSVVTGVVPGPIAAGASVNYSFTTKANLSALGTYNIEARTNLPGDQATSNDVVTHSITLSAAPALPTVASGPTTICSGSSVTLTASSTTPGVTYQWLKNNLNIANATSATYTANAAGAYTVIANLNGCASAASLPINLTVAGVPATPSVTRTGNLLTSNRPADNQWFKNSVAIPGATATTYTVTSNGIYSVKVITNGCSSSSSNIITINTLGINDDKNNLEVSIFPNPSASIFNLVLQEGKTNTLIVSDLTGKVMQHETVNSKTTQLDLSQAAKGIYLLKIVSEGKTAIRKLIVE